MLSLWTAVALLAVAGEPAPPSDKSGVAFSRAGEELRVSVAGQPFATYVWPDPKVRRPFLAHVRTPAGVQVTRNFPPVAGRDATDHDTMHPGVWLAFGDLGGADFWRNKGVVRHAGFVEEPKGGAFAVRNRYEAGDRVVCEEVCRLTFQPRPGAVLLVWDSTFRGEGEFAFGDQEEMGLGVRLATPLTERHGGVIADSAGRKGEKAVWGRTADWCSYGGTSDGRRAGVVLMPDPGNFRPSWWHVRGYGLMVANPFGRNAFTKGEKSQVVVRPGETLRLRFGLLAHDGDADPAAAYRDFVQVLGASKKVE